MALADRSIRRKNCSFTHHNKSSSYKKVSEQGPKNFSYITAFRKNKSQKRWAKRALKNCGFPHHIKCSSYKWARKNTKYPWKNCPRLAPLKSAALGSSLLSLLANPVLGHNSTLCDYYWEIPDSILHCLPENQTQDLLFTFATTRQKKQSKV